MSEKRPLLRRILQVKGIPADLHQAFKVQCTIDGVSMSEKVVELIREYLKKQEKKKGK